MIEQSILQEEFSFNNEGQMVLANNSKHIPIKEFLQKEVEKIDFDAIEKGIHQHFFFHANASHELLKAATHYAIDENAIGRSNYDIYNNLIEKGFDENIAFSVVRNQEEKSIQINEDSEIVKLVGWCIVSLGFMLFCLGTTNGDGSKIGICGLIFAIFGALILLTRNFQIKKYSLPVKKEGREQVINNEVNWS